MPALLCIFHLGSAKHGRRMEPGYQCTPPICSIPRASHHLTTGCWIWPTGTPRSSASSGCSTPQTWKAAGATGRGGRRRGKKGLIVRERRVGNFTGRPEQSLEETQALSMVPPTPWVIYGMETMLEKQTLLSPACFAPSADIQPPLAMVLSLGSQGRGGQLDASRMTDSCS